MIAKYYDPSYPLPCTAENEALELYLELEPLYMPSPGYLEKPHAKETRERAVSVIFNIAKRENLKPSIPYVAMSYFDRHMWMDNPLPDVLNEGPKDVELLSVCCLTLACKLMNKDFSMVEFKERHSELENITPAQFLTMELCIICARGIDWHLRAVTPLCFVRFFAQQFDSPYGFRRRTINQILVNAQNDSKNTRFRPSVMAASALLAASWFLYPNLYHSFVDKMLSQEIFEEGDLLKCTKGLIRQCKELNILIESAVAKNEDVPRMEVIAEGEISEDESEKLRCISMPETSALGGMRQWLRRRDPRPSHKVVAPLPLGQATETSAETFAAEKPKESAKQVATEGGQSSAGTSKGKEKVSEVEMTEVLEMAEDSEDLQMRFTLRWKLGEMDAHDFSIFTKVFDSVPVDLEPAAPEPAVPDQADPAAPEANLPQAEVNPLHHVWEFCCYCCCCCSNPF